MKFAFFIFLLLSSLKLSLAQSGEQSPATRSVYSEAGGAGYVYSLNYNFRFNKNQINSWGMRAGIGGYAHSNASLLAVPLQLTRLIGKNRNYLELGIGLTLFAFNNRTRRYCARSLTDSDGNTTCLDFVNKSDQQTFVLDMRGSPNAMGTLLVGYRYIPDGEGFMWNLSIYPLFNRTGFWPLWPGIGIGYAF